MKFKIDFVTNSSSTSYLFLFKGTTIEELFESMKENYKEFELSYSFYDNEVNSTNVYEIINYMMNKNIDVKMISTKIKKLEKQINELLNDSKDDNCFERTITNHLIGKYNRIIEELKFQQDEGFRWVCETSFSDEENNKTGSIMRCLSFEIDKPNLVIICE